MVEQKLTEIKNKLEKLEEKTSKKIPKHLPINWESEKTFHKCKFFLTGFGKFGHHLVNPTTHIINYLQSNTKQLNEEKPYAICDSRVLEVTTTACRQYYDDIIPIMNQQKFEEQNEPLNIVIHFGLYSGCGQFQLESIGKNYANFSIPDMAGNQLKDEKICKDYPKTHFLKTTLPVEDLVSKMKSHFPKENVNKSQSAGDYICNYIYYVSLYHSFHEKFHSIFIHVPEFSEIKEEIQYSFAVKLLDEIYQCYSSNIVKKEEPMSSK